MTKTESTLQDALCIKDMPGNGSFTPMKLQNANRADPLAIFCALLLWTIIFLLYSKISHAMTGDMFLHLSTAEGIALRDPATWITQSHPVWHLSVVVCNRLGMTYPYASAFVTAGFGLLAYLAVHAVLTRLLQGTCTRNTISLAALGINLVSAICIPWVNPHVYLGSGSPNPWHNPTQYTVKWLIVLLVPFFIYAFLNPKPVKNGAYTMPLPKAVILGLLCAYSAWAKPVLMVVFGPAVACFLIIELIVSKGKAFPFCVVTALAFIPALAIMARQYLYLFGPYASDGSGLGLFWKISNPYVSTEILVFGRLLLYGFPLFVVLAFERRNIFKNKYLMLSVLLVLVAEFEAIMLHETGGRENHGNFGWCKALVAFNIWVVAAACFLRRWENYKKQPQPSFAQNVLFSCGWALAGAHLISGVYYVIRYYITMDFL